MRKLFIISINSLTYLAVVIFALSFFVYTDFGVKTRYGYLFIACMLGLAALSEFLTRKIQINTLQVKYILLAMSISMFSIMPNARIEYEAITLTMTILLSAIFVISPEISQREIMISTRLIEMAGLFFSLYVVTVAAYPNLFYNYVAKIISSPSREYAMQILSDGYGVPVGRSAVFIIYVIVFALFINACRMIHLSKKIEALDVFTLILLTVALLLENRKTETLATFITLLVLLAIHSSQITKEKKKQIKKLLIISITVLVVFSIILASKGYFDRYIVFIEKLAKRQAGVNTDVSSGRIYLWSKAIELFKETPLFGIGWGQFTTYISEVGYRMGENVNSAHNNYLQVLCETGIIGFMIIVPLFLAILKETITKSKKMSRTIGVQGVYQCATSISICFQLFAIIASFLDPIWYKTLFWWLFAISINLAKVTMPIKRDIES